MRQKIRVAMVLAILLTLVIPLTARAAVVGRFVMVTGETDLLKQGKPPGLPVKVNDGVERGDVVRTKSRAKAQIRFIDDSVLTLAPDSRIAVADYLYDQPRGERRAVVRVYKGLIHAVVTRILNVQQPDFLMETHTAGLGVRGTDWYTLIAPSATGVYLLQGRLDVHSNIAGLPSVLLRSMEYTLVNRGQPPLAPRPLTPATLALLRKMMDPGVQERLLVECGLTPEACLPGGGVPGGVPSQFPTGPEGPTQPTIPPVQKPPVLTPVPVAPLSPPPG